MTYAKLLQLLERLVFSQTLFHSGAGHQQRKQATSDFGKQGQLTDAAQGSLSQFEGPVQESPFYKALLTSGTEQTSRAYDNARSNMRQRANMAGFGYNQPAEQGAESQLSAREASDMARLPNEAMLATAPMTLSAAGQTAGMGMGYGAQGAGMLNQNAGNTFGLYRQLLQTGGEMANAAASGYGSYMANS